MTYSVLSADITIEGDVVAAKETLLIDGRVSGRVQGHNVTIGENAKVDGDLVAETVSIKGRFTGRVTCSELAVDETTEICADLHVGGM